MNILRYQTLWGMLLIPLTAITYYFSHFAPNPAYHYAIAAALVVGSVFSLRYASIAYLVAMIVIDDFPKYYTEDMAYSSPFTSLYQLQIGGMTLFMLLATYFACVNLLAFVQQTRKGTTKSTSKTRLSQELRVILIAGSVAALFGLLNITDALRYYISDLGFFVDILLGYMIIRNVSNDSSSLNLTFRLIIYASISKMLIVVLDGMFFTPGVITIKPGSDSYFVAGAVIYALVQIRGGSGRYSLIRKAFFASVIVLAAFYHIVTASRGRMLISLLAILLYFVASRGKSAVTFALLFLLGVATLIDLLPDEFFGYFFWKVNSLSATSADSDSAMVRLISLKNIVAQQIHTVYQIVVGTGLGGFFTSKYYPFPTDLTGKNAFNDAWLAADKFYKPHGSWMFLLLKTGWIGFLAIFGTILRQTFKRIGYMRNRPGLGNANKGMLYVAMPLAALNLIISFTGKLEIMSGVFFALAYYALNTQRQMGHIGSSNKPAAGECR